ncbi:MAG: CHASE2 domain-containing protein [Pedobacter sp.]
MLLFGGLLFSVVICVIYLIQPAFVNSTNNRTTDVVMSFAQAQPASGSVVIVDIDEGSLAKYGQWPWPRNRLAQLLRIISMSGAASIGLDLILAEADRTSPANLQSNINLKNGYHTITSRSRSSVLNNDDDLADTLAKGPIVLGFDFLFKDNSKPETSCSLHPPGIAWINKSNAGQIPTSFFRAKSVVCNRQMFTDAVAHSGFLNATPDADGTLRRIPMLIEFEGNLYPSLTLAMLMQYANSSQISVLQRESSRLDLIVGNRSIITDDQGNMIVQFSRRAEATPRISAADLLRGKIPSDQLKNKIILVGSSAAGLDYMYRTPNSPVQTYMDIHAQVLNNLLTGQQVIRTREFLLWEILASLFLALCACLAIARMSILPSAAVCVTMLAGSWISMVYIFRAQGYLFSPLLPSILVTLNYVTLTIFKTWKIQVATRKKADDTMVQLKSSEKNLTSIVKAVPDVIFRLDPTGCITFISPSISKYSASPDALIGQSIFVLVIPEDLEKAKYRLNEKRTGERATRDLELRLLLRSKFNVSADEPGHFRVTAEGVYQDETPRSCGFIGTQGIIHDITEQKKLEEKLQNAQKMETIGNLAAGVAHDLNNILSGLVTYPELIMMDLPADSPLRNKIKLIQQSGQRAAAIVQDLLTLGRRGVKSNAVVNINIIILEYLASLEFKTVLQHHSNTTLENYLAPDILNIMGSRSHLLKVIMNLLINAAEAMPAGGIIKISSFNKYLDTSYSGYEEIPSGEYVCISIDDQGIGISEEDQRRIFEPFYSKKTMKRSGSGLGMTIIWTTIKDHLGYIDIQSREGYGTSFVIYMPACRDQTEASNHRNVLEEYVGTEHVLVVDDIPEQRQIVTSMLTKLGYAVSSCGSGEEAVEFLRTKNADLVVLDMIMPGGIDGLETYVRLNGIRPGQKAIITSGFSESERVKSLQQLGAGAYVQKPYTLEKLGIAVRQELDRG